MLHLSGTIRARTHRLSDAWNKFPCHINVCSGESESLVKQLPPLSARQRHRLRFAINLSHLTADPVGTRGSTPLCRSVPRRDISCPFENKPEIWLGWRMVWNRSPPQGCYISCVSRPGHVIRQKVEIVGVGVRVVNRLQLLWQNWDCSQVQIRYK